MLIEQIFADLLLYIIRVNPLYPRSSASYFLPKSQNSSQF